MSDPELYDLDFVDLYDIEFDELSNIGAQSVGSDQAVPTTVSEVTLVNTEASGETNPNMAGVGLLDDPIQPQVAPTVESPSLNRDKWVQISPPDTKKELSSFIQNHRSNKLSVARIIQEHYGVRRLPDDIYRQLLNDLFDLQNEGIVAREANTPFVTRIVQPTETHTFESVPENLDSATFLKAARFVQSLTMYATRVEGNDGIKMSVLAKDFGNGLRISTEAGKKLVKQLEDGGLLYCAGHSKGTRLVTTDPTREVVSTKRLKEGSHKEDDVWTEGDKEIIDAVLDTLIGVKHYEQGMTLEKIWTDSYIALAVDEKDYRRVVRRLKAAGIIQINTRQQKPKVRFVNTSLRDLWKEDRDKILEIAGLKCFE